MKKELNQLFECIAKDFAEWHARGEYGKDSDYEDFYNKLSVEEGRKYYKIVKTDNQRMVWGFVVKSDTDKKFKKGDILMAAGWAAPARNKPRGNILDGDFNWVRWTGPAYL